MPYHGYPDDHWRFTIEDAKKIFSDMEILALRADRGDPGILLVARKKRDVPFTDLSGIEVGHAPPKPAAR
jgi:hypothetical protein